MNIYQWAYEHAEDWKLICGLSDPFPTDQEEINRIAGSLIANGHESAFYVMMTRWCVENDISLTDRF